MNYNPNEYRCPECGQTRMRRVSLLEIVVSAFIWAMCFVGIYTMVGKLVNN